MPCETARPGDPGNPRLVLFRRRGETKAGAGRTRGRTTQIKETDADRTRAGEPTLSKYRGRGGASKCTPQK
eukprot:gene9162-biopygen10716